MGSHKVSSVLSAIADLSVADSLRWFAENFSAVSFSTSFGIEDQIITHEIFEHNFSIEVFTLDTGRLFPETYTLWARTKERYQKPIVSYFPDATHLEKYLNENGPNAFYDSPDLRKACCHVRKVEPLNRALKGKEIWVTGLRAEHSPNRQTMEQVEWDEAHQVLKFHPLLHWTGEQVKEYVAKNNVLYNPLHDKGFVSIGCAPCTRAIQEGEDFRAGRWWWEDSSKKECGLHVR